MNPSWKHSLLLCAIPLCVLISSAQSPSPDSLQWQARNDPSEKSVVAEAVAGGNFVAGKDTGASQFIVACERERNRCADCGQRAREVVTMYRLSWIIPPQSSFYFEPFALGGGGQDDLATLGIGGNPPTPRHSGEHVLPDGNWLINVYAKPEDILALSNSSASEASVRLVLHQFTDHGLPAIVISSKAPTAGPALQSVLDACSNSVDRAGDTSTCEPRPGEELVEIKVCQGPPPMRCDDPEKTQNGAVWHLTTFGSKESGAVRYYRLHCGYRKKGAEDSETAITDAGLSRRLQECDETLNPLSVSCR